MGKLSPPLLFHLLDAKILNAYRGLGGWEELQKYQLSGQRLETEMSGSDPGRCYVLWASPEISLFLCNPQGFSCGNTKE